jgi:hypothetical protein
MDCHTQSFVLVMEHKKKLKSFVVMDLQQYITQHQPGQKEYQLMIPCGILCHVMPQHFRVCMGLFQCYLLQLIEWKQGWFSLSNVTGNGEQERRAEIHLSQYKEHKNTPVIYMATMVIMLYSAKLYYCHLSLQKMRKAHQNICMDYKLSRS